MRGFIGSPANMEHFPMEYLYEPSDTRRMSEGRFSG
jgi:hypothetical protein